MLYPLLLDRVLIRRRATAGASASASSATPEPASSAHAAGHFAATAVAAALLTSPALLAAPATSTISAIVSPAATVAAVATHVVAAHSVSAHAVPAHAAVAAAAAAHAAPAATAHAEAARAVLDGDLLDLDVLAGHVDVGLLEEHLCGLLLVVGDEAKVLGLVLAPVHGPLQLDHVAVLHEVLLDLVVGDGDVGKLADVDLALLRSCLLDGDLLALDGVLLFQECRQDLLCGKDDECEPSRPAGHGVHLQVDRGHLAERGKVFPDVFFCRFLRQTSGEDLAVVLVALAIFCVVHGGVFGHFVFG